MTTTLTVTDHGTTLDFTYEDALRYHGPQAPGGVAHAYKVLERALGVFGAEAPSSVVTWSWPPHTADQECAMRSSWSRAR